MSKFKDLTIKNFLSIGNQTQSLSLDKNFLTLILGSNLDSSMDGAEGRNGTGKSTIANAICYALFGQAIANIKVNNLINKINDKNMLVTLSFEINNINYRIERGRKPNILKMYVNDVEHIEVDNAQGDNRETQKYINDLFNMSAEMYKHIISLNTYSEPFLSLSNTAQRPIIEQLLGITILSEKADVLKELLKETKDNIQTETVTIDAVQRSNERIQQSIDTLRIRQNAWNKQHTDTVDSLANAIVTLELIDINNELKLHDELEQYLTAKQSHATLTKDRALIESAITQSSRTADKYNSELAKLANHECHACGQKIHDTAHAEMTDSIKHGLAETIAYLTDLDEELENINELLGSITIGPPPHNTYYASKADALAHQNNLITLTTQLESKATESDPYQEQIDELSNTALQEISWDRMNALTRTKEHQEVLLKLLTNKDSFIRKKIIDQNLAYLNTRLTYYLQKMGLPHHVEFLNDLSVEITQVGQNLDFHNLSRGEMTRVSLSLSWAFRDVYENLFGPLNLLFVDELIDNGLDAAGVESALSVLKGFGRDRNKNVFLISHREELVGRVNNVLNVVKENNFTSFSIDTEVANEI